MMYPVWPIPTPQFRYPYTVFHGQGRGSSPGRYDLFLFSDEGRRVQLDE